VAVIIAVRAGTQDARMHRSPYLWRLSSNPAERRHLVGSALKDVGKLFIMAVTLDSLLQIAQDGRIYPLQALIVGFVLAIIPYVLVRGPVTRIASRVMRG
jgi:hypothetical protein